MSELDGFVTAAVTGLPFPDPQYWMLPMLGLPYDALDNGSELEFAAFASVVLVHNRINQILFDNPVDFQPRFALKPNGNVDPRPWC